MNELSLKLSQVQYLQAILKPILADKGRDVRVAALCLALADTARSLELPEKIGLIYHLNEEIFGPEPVESQLERYIKELQDAQKADQTGS